MDIISPAQSKTTKPQTKYNDVPFPLRSRCDTAEYGSVMWEFDPDNHHLHPRLTRLLYSKLLLRSFVVTASVTILINVAATKIPKIIVWMGCNLPRDICNSICDDDHSVIQQGRVEIHLEVK